MRALFDPKDAAARQRGDDSPLNRGSVPLGGVPKPRATAPRATAVISAPADKQSTAGTGRVSTFLSGIGLSPKRFLAQLQGKLGQRTLLSGP